MDSISKWSLIISLGLSSLFISGVSQASTKMMNNHLKCAAYLDVTVSDAIVAPAITGKTLMTQDNYLRLMVKSRLNLLAFSKGNPLKEVVRQFDEERVVIRAEAGKASGYKIDGRTFNTNRLTEYFQYLINNSKNYCEPTEVAIGKLQKSYTSEREFESAARELTAEINKQSLGNSTTSSTIYDEYEAINSEDTVQGTTYDDDEYEAIYVEEPQQ